jgi:hypothetical protein
VLIMRMCGSRGAYFLFLTARGRHGKVGIAIDYSFLLDDFE